MADQLLIVYYQLVQESINYSVETDPDQKQAIAARINHLWTQYNLLLQAPVTGINKFHPPPPPPPGTGTAPSA